jgi:hypothetical protein
MEFILIVSAPLQIVAFNKGIDPFLDRVNLRHKVNLDCIDSCCLELFICHFLFRLHDSNNCSIKVVLAVAFDRDIGTLRLLGLKCDVKI